jgi:multidrug transporter EmrE-like cation transporter
MKSLDQMALFSGRVFLFLLIAAILEVLGDSFLQTAVHHSSGVWRWIWLIGGAAALSTYGLMVNLPTWNFGRLLGVYVVFFFIAAQVVAKIRFQQPTTPAVLAGGSLIVAGGLIIWKG